MRILKEHKIEAILAEVLKHDPCGEPILYNVPHSEVEDYLSRLSHREINKLHKRYFAKDTDRKDFTRNLRWATVRYRCTSNLSSGAFQSKSETNKSSDLLVDSNFGMLYSKPKEKDDAESGVWLLCDICIKILVGVGSITILLCGIMMAVTLVIVFFAAVSPVFMPLFMIF